MFVSWFVSLRPIPLFELTDWWCISVFIYSRMFDERIFTGKDVIYYVFCFSISCAYKLWFVLINTFDLFVNSRGNASDMVILYVWHQNYLFSFSQLSIIRVDYMRFKLDTMKYHTLHKPDWSCLSLGDFSNIYSYLISLPTPLSVVQQD